MRNRHYTMVPPANGSTLVTDPKDAQVDGVIEMSG